MNVAIPTIEGWLAGGKYILDIEGKDDALGTADPVEAYMFMARTGGQEWRVTRSENSFTGADDENWAATVKSKLNRLGIPTLEVRYDNR